MYILDWLLDYFFFDVDFVFPSDPVPYSHYCSYFPSSLAPPQVCPNKTRETPNPSYPPTIEYNDGKYI